MTTGPEIVPPDVLVDTIRTTLREYADASRADSMQSYMKSEMPFRGVAAPIRRKQCNVVFRRFRLGSKEDWTAAFMTLWRKASFREERYEAIDLAGFRYYRDWQTPELLPLYEEMIVTGAWWDFVDEIAARRVGLLLRRYPSEVKPEMLKWSTSDDLWKRRTSIICQLMAKEETDVGLLFRTIEASLTERDFFLRKAIGWALRQHAKTDPDEVRRYVAEHEHLMSGLSKREAMKHL